MKKQNFIVRWWESLRNGWKSRKEAGLKQSVNERVYISDYELNGKTVVALLVGGTMVDYIDCDYSERDPEGYLLHNGVQYLICRLHDIRKEELNRQKGGML